MVVASADYLARHMPPMTPRDLTAHGCIRLRFPSSAIRPWQFEKNGRQVDVAVEGRLTLNDPELDVKAARDGVGMLTWRSAMAGRRSNLGVGSRAGGPADAGGGDLFVLSGRRQLLVPLRVFIEFPTRELRGRLRRDHEMPAATAKPETEPG